jgi:hypothetical protein
MNEVFDESTKKLIEALGRKKLYISFFEKRRIN